MTEVLIDGVKYISSEDAFQLQIEQVRGVLESQGFLSQMAIEGIIESLKNLENSPSEKPISKKPSPSWKKPINYSNIAGFDDEGHAIFKIGGRSGNSSIWTIHQLKDIQHEVMNNEKPFSRVRFLTKKHGLSSFLIRNLIFNIVEGNCDKLFQMWDERYVEPKMPPIINNPQKRKEMGWF